MRFRTAYGTDEKRRRMVDRQIRRRGVSDERVLDAMGRVPRHAFIPAPDTAAAYSDCALPIGHGATISQPYIVAVMTEALQVGPGTRILEIGTGSGYQAAVLATCGCTVFTMERVVALYERACETLRSAGFAGVNVRLGDGTRGWPEEAPFDRILITAAAPEVPRPLLDQLSDGGLLVAPVGDDWLQVIRRYRKEGESVRSEDLEGVRFVPLIEDSEE
jgi:protein-L-isoaspartate(D-aspartate) O-methyltransferase